MANIEKIVLPDNTQYNIKDANALPKTAGSSEPLTGNLYINNSSNPAVMLCDNGGNSSALFTSATDSNYCNLAKTDSEGTIKSGLRLQSSGNNNNAILYGYGGLIVFRPNGFGDSAGQAYINSTGVLVAQGMYTTTRSGSTLVIDSSGNIGRTSSLRKYKKDIEDVTEEQADKGYELRPITYVSAIEDDIKERQFGFIAEEVEEVVPELCTYDLDGNVDGVAYERVCSLLLKQNQMLKAQVDALEKRVEELERK